ncbi:hypothetical protein Tco_0313310, partial [Tanacetum coccineum]
FDTSAGNPIKEILLKLNLPNHRILKDGGEEFQERCLIQAFKTKKQQQYEHVGLKVTSTQDGKRSQDDDLRLCLVDDLKEVIENGATLPKATTVEGVVTEMPIITVEEKA